MLFIRNKDFYEYTQYLNLVFKLISTNCIWKKSILAMIPELIGIPPESMLRINIYLQWQLWKKQMVISIL